MLIEIVPVEKGHVGTFNEFRLLFQTKFMVEGILNEAHQNIFKCECSTALMLRDIFLRDRFI